MNILFIDDKDERHQIAEKAFSGSKHILLHAYNKKTVMALVKDTKIPFDLIMFDHDLGENEPNGSNIASSILELDESKWPKKVIVHSDNYGGAMNILSKFNSAGAKTRYTGWNEGLCKEIRMEMDKE